MTHGRTKTSLSLSLSPVDNNLLWLTSTLCPLSHLMYSCSLAVIFNKPAGGEVGLTANSAFDSECLFSECLCVCVMEYKGEERTETSGGEVGVEWIHLEGE